jgi:hypothetical protein
MSAADKPGSTMFDNGGVLRRILLRLKHALQEEKRQKV